MTKRTNLQERYELREALGRGGMGVVYKAYDTLMKREVALKTILVDDPETVALFYKEWTILTTMVHPNVINIYDIGEFEHDGAKKPFFVMPLLPGVTLDRLIKDSSPRLTVKGVLDIICQACLGLQAAHEQGLIHRDVKPSNIFVMDDNSVKIIDFGIARTASAHTKTTLKGTLFYLAAEQLDMQPPSPLSDLYALAVVTYEALTRHRPFSGSNDVEVVEAIRRHVPPPITEQNHEVNYAISQVVHKAMAKQPWHRFSTIREYGDALQKAFRNQPLEYFDNSKIKPRLERASQSFAAGDYDFASEVLTELEAEGYLEQGIVLLRGQVDRAVRQTRILQALENARRFFAATEYSLALRKVQEALDLDPNDASALALKGQVEKDRREKKISEWIVLARQHVENQAFRQAREALDNVLQLKPNETDALRLLSEVQRREQEVAGIRAEKSNLYQAAVQAWEKGEVSAALTKLEVLIAMDHDQPETDSGRSGAYQSFYSQVHSEHNALKNSYDEARRNLSANNFDAALVICKQSLVKYPNHALFQALKFDIDERQRHNLSAVIAETDRRVEEEPDLDRRAGILEEALQLYPGESHFERAMQLVRDKRDLVNSIVAKARFYEERGQFIEALDQWQILKSIHEKHPGLTFEIQRLIKQRDQQALRNSKARWVEQTGRYLESGDYDQAMKTVLRALAEFPSDPELLELEKVARKNQEQAKQAAGLLASSESGGAEQDLDSLRKAHELDPRNTVIRTVLVNTLVSKARQLIDSDSESAERIVKEVMQLQPNHAPAQSLESQIGDRKRAEFVNWCLSQARRLQAEGDIGGAMAIAVQGLGSYPNESRLQQLQATLQRVDTEFQQRQQSPTVPPPTPEDSTPASGSVFTPEWPTAVQPRVEQPSFFEPPSRVPVEPARIDPAPRRVMLDPQQKLWLGVVVGAAAIIVLVLAAGAMPKWFAHKESRSMVVTPPAAPAKYTVNFHSSPAGAEITVNGEPCGQSTCAVQLPAGDYRAEASLSDHEPAGLNFRVNAGQTPPDIGLTLRPAPPLLTIATDLASGTVLVDQAPAGEIQNGELRIPNLDPGRHTLFIQDGGFQAKMTLGIEKGAMPRVTAPIQTKGMQAVVVVHSGKQARVYSSHERGTAVLDGKPVGILDRDGLALKDLASGSHELVLEWPHQESTRMVFDSGSSTAVFASFLTGQLAVLTITANQDGADVYLNGEKSRETNHGRLRLYLKPTRYSIRVQKTGFASEEKLIELRKSEEATLDFKLTALKPPNQVSVAGKSAEMDGGPQKVTGTLKIELNPRNVEVHLKLRRDGELQDRDINETTMNLPEGGYTITASAPKYLDAVTSVRVVADRTITAGLTLKHADAPPPGVTPPVGKTTQISFGIGEWLKTGAWTREGEVVTRSGGDFVLAPVDFRQGTIQFVVAALQGKRIEWVVGFRDQRNYYSFQLDESDLTRYEVVDGKRSKGVRTPLGFKRNGYIGIRLSTVANGILIAVEHDGAQWRSLDSWVMPGGPQPGKFGFNIAVRDRLGMSEFQLTTTN